MHPPVCGPKDLLTHIHLLHRTRSSKIFKKGQNWSMEFLQNNHLDNITSMKFDNALLREPWRFEIWSITTSAMHRISQRQWLCTTVCTKHTSKTSAGRALTGRQTHKQSGPNEPYLNQLLLVVLIATKGFNYTLLPLWVNIRASIPHCIKAQYLSEISC